MPNQVADVIVVGAGNAALASAVSANNSFNKLPIPFRAIATDLQTGEKVVLEKGSLPQAIRDAVAEAQSA